VHHYSDLK